MLDSLGEVEMMMDRSGKSQIIEMDVWMCLGDVYVHGIMDGEAWPQHDFDNELDPIFIT